MPIRAISSVLFSWKAAMLEGLGLFGLVSQLGLPAPVEAILQLGALGILGYAVYRLFGVVEALMKAAKADRDAQQAERKAQHEEREAQKEERQSHISVLSRLCDNMDSLRETVFETKAHCASVLAEREPAPHRPDQ